MIEYVTGQWNPFTGCEHSQKECPTADKCWAREMSRRFQPVCGGDFEPRWHLDRLDLPLSWRKPRRVAVCFMGDLFGAWNEDKHDSRFVRIVLQRVRDCPQHQFLFLTKRPEALAQYNLWPSNAWVGCSITGAETPQRQAEMLEALHLVDADVRWLSYEPALGPLAQPIPEWLDWVVVGAQTGKGAEPFDPRWLEIVELWARYTAILRRLGGKRWWKNNLLRSLGGFPLTQELPR